MTIENRRDRNIRADDEPMGQLILLPCLDSEERAALCREVLAIPRVRAAELGRTVVAAAETGVYTNAAGHPMHWQAAAK